jgi:hypothetical protein
MTGNKIVNILFCRKDNQSECTSREWDSALLPLQGAIVTIPGIGDVWVDVIVRDSALTEDYRVYYRPK